VREREEVQEVLHGDIGVEQKSKLGKIEVLSLKNSLWSKKNRRPMWREGKKWAVAKKKGNSHCQELEKEMFT
jgi:hypothetical protein